MHFTIVSTPNMDLLAKEGVSLEEFYVSPVCTPTRAHLMTGRYNYRTRAVDTYLGRANIEADEVTMAETLSDAGYSTGIFGKWHLGDYYPIRAIDQGFDEAVVHQGGGLRQPSNPPEGERYHDPILFHNGEPKRYEGYCTDIFFDEAAKYIETQAAAKKPFFAYIATNAPHGPFDEPPTRELFEEFQAKLPNDKKPTRAAFYSMIQNIDDNMGRLYSTLDELGISDNTIVLFMSDNGPAGGGSSGPYRGAKATIYQGGIRSVCFLRWPEKIKAGSKVAQTTAHIDLMPTLLDLCGVDAPKGIKIDGRSLRPLIEQKETDWADRHLFFQWHRGDTPQRYHSFAVVGPKGEWKLMHASNRGAHSFEGEPKFELFNLHDDIAETTDVAAQHPAKVDELKKHYDAWFDDVSSTREDNYAMEPIVIVSEHETTTVLTPQDKRTYGDDKKSWWSDGYWPVEMVKPGPYTVHVRLTGDAAAATDVQLKLQIDDKTWEQTVTVHRGVNATAIGDIEFPATGLGKFTASIDAEGSGVHVYQITLK
ncbi:MAG: arylsulfatase [Verrucomicrobiota bacterium]